MKCKDFISGDDTLNLIQDNLKQNNYTFTVKKNKIIVSASDRFSALQNFVKLFSQLKAVYNPEGSGSSLGRVERVRKAKKIQVDVTNELKNSREFSDFIKSVIGYGYILVHKIGSNIHCLDMTESVLDKLVKVKKAVILYPSGDAKRVDILVELNGLKLKFNFRNKSGGIYPSHLLADYSFI